MDKLCYLVKNKLTNKNLGQILNKTVKNLTSPTSQEMLDFYKNSSINFKIKICDKKLNIIWKYFNTFNIRYPHQFEFYKKYKFNSFTFYVFHLISPDRFCKSDDIVKEFGLDKFELINFESTITMDHLKLFITDRELFDSISKLVEDGDTKWTNSYIKNINNKDNFVKDCTNYCICGHRIIQSKLEKYKVMRYSNDDNGLMDEVHSIFCTSHSKYLKMFPDEKEIYNEFSTNKWLDEFDKTFSNLGDIRDTPSCLTEPRLFCLKLSN